MRSPWVRAISSTQRSTAESIPSPSRSIFRKPASAQESLSHCTICRPSIAAGTTGQQSISGLVATIIPPGCCDRWRAVPAPPTSRASQRPAPPGSARRWSGALARRCRGRARLVLRAAREALDLAGGKPEHLAQLADRAARAERGKAATSAERSLP